LQTDSIRIEKIMLKDLYGFSRRALRDPVFEDVLPITPARAFSQSKNPHGAPDDCVLLVAYADKRCVGYSGLVPGLFHHHDGLSKIYYASTFFISPAMRSKGIGQLMLNELKHLKVDIIFTGMTQSAKRAYDRIGFKKLGSLPFFQLRIEKINRFHPFWSAVFDALTSRQGCFEKFVFYLKQIESFFYRLSKMTWYRRVLNQYKNEKFLIRAVNQISSETEAARPARTEPEFIRGVEIVNWMLKHPWIRSSAEGEKKVKNYFFSSSRDFFKFFALEIYAADQKSLKGFLVLSVSRQRNRTVIKLLDFLIPAAELDWIGLAALRHARKFLADRIEFPAEMAFFFSQNRRLKPLLKRRKRLYLYQPQGDQSPLKKAAGKITLNYCDSDIAFF